MRLGDGQFAIDDRIHGENITASHDYPYGRRVTLTINGEVLEFHQHFNADYRDWFVDQALPMEWTLRVSEPAFIQGQRKRWADAQPPMETAEGEDG